MISEASDAGEEKYERFLYARVTEQNNGTPVSVVSALARGGHDPWKEAARLARLPADSAQGALKELLDQGLSRGLSFIEREDAARRLVLLLPSETSHMPMAASPIAKDAARQLACWLLWIGYIVVLILVQEHNRAPSHDIEYPATKSQFAETSGKSDRSSQSIKAERTINGTSSNED